MRTRIFSLAVATAVSLCPVVASAAGLQQASLPSPVELKGAVDAAIARGGLTNFRTKALRNQANDLVRLEARYASDRYSTREKMEIARRSRYLITTLVTALNGGSAYGTSKAYAGVGPSAITQSDVSVNYISR